MSLAGQSAAGWKSGNLVGWNYKGLLVAGAKLNMCRAAERSADELVFTNIAKRYQTNCVSDTCLITGWADAKREHVLAFERWGEPFLTLVCSSACKTVDNWSGKLLRNRMSAIASCIQKAGWEGWSADFVSINFTSKVENKETSGEFVFYEFDLSRKFRLLTEVNFFIFHARQRARLSVIEAASCLETECPLQFHVFRKHPRMVLFRWFFWGGQISRFRERTSLKNFTSKTKMENRIRKFVFRWNLTFPRKLWWMTKFCAQSTCSF